jgi:hypothetical protein
MDCKSTKGVCVVSIENGEEKFYTKYNYILMKNAGRNVELVACAPTLEELKKKIGKKD